jgi:hypothetical protein
MSAHEVRSERQRRKKSVAGSTCRSRDVRSAYTKARQHRCQRASVLISISQFERKSGGWQSARAVVNNFLFNQDQVQP